MKKLFLYNTLFFLFYGCIDKIELKEQSIPKKLIVAGTMSNLPGPYTISLAYSTPYNSKKITEVIGSADVSISDNLGNTYPLKQIALGIYKTDSVSFKGIVGRIYQVNITTIDGKQYRSKPEMLLEPVPIDTVTTRFITGNVLLSTYDILVKVKDPSVSRNYYRWKWRNYDTTDYCLIERGRLPNGKSVVVKVPCCEKCWTITECFGCLTLLSDNLINGKVFTQKIANIPYDDDYDYFMQIEQYSISKENYNYWNLVKGQIYNSGGIFDNTPAFIEGNVYNIKDSSEQVLGIFNVVGITKKNVYIPRYMKEVRPYIQIEVDSLIIAKDCYQCKAINRTPVKPEGWRG